MFAPLSDGDFVFPVKHEALTTLGRISARCSSVASECDKDQFVNVPLVISLYAAEPYFPLLLAERPSSFVVYPFPEVKADGPDVDELSEKRVCSCSNTHSVTSMLEFTSTTDVCRMNLICGSCKYRRSVADRGDGTPVFCIRNVSVGTYCLLAISFKSDLNRLASKSTKPASWMTLLHAKENRLKKKYVAFTLWNLPL